MTHDRDHRRSDVRHGDPLAFDQANDGAGFKRRDDDVPAPDEGHRVYRERVDEVEHRRDVRPDIVAVEFHLRARRDRVRADDLVR